MSNWNFFGRLNLDALKHDAIASSVGFSILLGGIGLVALLTYTKRWKWLWIEWLTSLDHKKIAIMYLVLSSVMLFKGIVDALMLRSQQLLSIDEARGYLSEAHFQQLFTA